ncbi:MAG: RNA 2',3'-cyclic phosphodiesterase [Phycisphaerae bacterium]|nr:RNA 2',3'-cyclic phosphodiesterase [Phycisphaerae bacterium]
MRTFIAIELEPALRGPLLKLLRGLPPAEGVRWVTERQLHLTLKFLGEVRDAQLSQVCDAVVAAGSQVEPFSLRIKGLGVFPAPRNPRVLWCGVEDPTKGCRRWVEAADPLLAKLNFKPETRAYTPHITLGRSRSSAGARVLREVLETAPPLETEQMQVERVVVIESRLLPTGAQYKPLATVSLGPS